MNYYERHIGDYLKDTAHLSLLEHGVYTRLMDVYYTREGGIPAADAARLIGARSRDEKAALVAVLGEFFELVDGAHRQERCEREIERYKDKQAKAKRSAEARWSQGKQESDGNANASGDDDADGMRSHTEGNAPRARSRHQTPDTSNHTPYPQGELIPSGFAEFWEAWPKSDRKGGKAKCEELWQKARLDAIKTEIVSHVRRMAASEDWRKDGGQFIPAPIVYLRNKRWDGADDGGQTDSLGLQGGV